MTRYFNNVDCIEELKKQYFALAKKYHSDINGGSDEAMKEINAQYSDLFKRYKDIHRSARENSEEKTYTAEKSTAEAPEDFINIINQLLNLGVDVELSGRWLWISGNTMPVKDQLKAIGCKWCSKKKVWSWHYPEDSSRRHKPWTEEKRREVYGSVRFTASPTPLLV